MLENETDPVDETGGNPNRDGGHDSGFDAIEPIDFEPGGAQAASGPAAHRWLLFGSMALLVLLLGAAAYLFSGSSVLVAFDPPAQEVSVEGGLLELKFGDRWLLHSGQYQVTASLDGYYDFQQTIDVDSRPDQQFLFELIKLPGYLNLATRPALPARVWIDSDPVGTAPLERLELRPGDYQIAVRAERYQPFETTVVIEGGDLEQSVETELQPAWANVTLSSSPVGATLYVDGEPMGETPIIAEIMEGGRGLELRLDGYKSWSTRLDVVAQQPETLADVILEKADNIIQVASNPGGASVTVDGEYRGQTPMALALAPGQRYRIGFAKAGYLSNQRVLDVVAGDEANLQVRLEPVLGGVLVSGSPADAEVFIDGLSRGRMGDRFRLPAHPHRIEVRLEGFESFSTTVTPNPELDQRVDVALQSFEDLRQARMPPILDTGAGYQLKLVQPTGIIRTGSGRREQGRRSNEFMRQVQLQRPFYVGLTEVTNEQFWQFKAEHDSGVIERSTLSLKRQPVVRVSWNDAARFCNWLSQSEGLPAAYTDMGGTMVAAQPMNTGFRLPTEAEWAYVARYAGNPEGRAAMRYPWGANMPPGQGAGNYAGMEANMLNARLLQNYRDSHAATAQVGEYPPSSLGLFDIGGNVREWMHDFYIIHTGGLGEIPVDPMGPSSGTTHAIRGSGWRSASITELRLAYRDEGVEGADDVGFRVVRYAE